MFPRQAIYRLLRHAGAYKSCTSGYRRAQLAKSIPNSEYHLKTILSDADLQLLYGLSDRRTVLRG